MAQVDRTANQADDAIDSAAGLGHRAVERLQDAASSMQSSLRSGAQSVMENAQDWMSRGRDAVEPARGLVGANPFTSVALAVVAGFLLGWLLKQK